MSVQYLIPGKGYVAETTNTSFFIPGWLYFRGQQVAGVFANIYAQLWMD